MSRLTCTYCGEEIPDGEVEKDHLIPESKKGTDDDWNMVISCRECNQIKKDFDPRICTSSTDKEWLIKISIAYIQGFKDGALGIRADSPL